MKTSLIIILACIFACGTMFGQDADPEEPGLNSIQKNSIYLEILGNAAVWSANYDRIIPFNNKVAMFLRLGGNEYHGVDTDKLSFNILGATGILYGGPGGFLDTGIGYTHFTGYPDRLIIATAGYRFQGPKGLIFRATPMYIYNTEKGDVFGNCFWFGLSFGYSF